MTWVLSILNAVNTGLFDLLMWPFRRVHPFWPLVLVSIATGILMLWVFGKVSDQDTIRVVRDRIRGNVIGIRLFGDDIGLLFRLQGRILLQTLGYMRYALPGLAVTIIPVLLVLTQMNLRFGARPLLPGERILVKVTLRDAATVERGVFLDLPEGLVQETPAVRVAARREVAWRVRAEQVGHHVLTVRTGDEVAQKKLLVGEGFRAVPTLRSSGFLDNLLYPGEPPIGASRLIESIEVRYRALGERGIGWNLEWPVTYWIVTFLVVSVAAGFAFRGVLGVEI